MMKEFCILWLLCGVLAMSYPDSQFTPLNEERTNVNLLSRLESKINTLLEASQDENMKMERIIHTTELTDKRVRELTSDQHKYEMCAAQLEQTNAQLGLLETQLADIKTELVDTKTKLAAKDNELVATITEFVDVKTKLAAKDNELVDTTTELVDTRTELVDTRTELVDIKTVLADKDTELSGTTTKLVETNTKLANSESQLTETKRKLEECKAKLPPDFSGHDISTISLGSQFFTIVWERMDWDQAREFCKRYGKDLAEPEDSIIWDFINQYKTSHMEKFGTGQWWNAWVGASQQTEDTPWRWISGAELSTDHEAWYSGGIPWGAARRGGRACAYIHSYYATMWDVKCDYTSYFICGVTN